MRHLLCGSGFRLRPHSLPPACITNEYLRSLKTYLVSICGQAVKPRKRPPIFYFQRKHWKSTYRESLRNQYFTYSHVREAGRGSATWWARAFRYLLFKTSLLRVEADEQAQKQRYYCAPGIWDPSSNYRSCLRKPSSWADARYLTRILHA